MAFGLSAGAVTAIGMGAGALLGGGSSGGTTTSTVDNSPWGPAQGYLLGTPGTGGTRQLRPGATPISGGERRRVRDPNTDAWTWETTPAQYAESDYITTDGTGGTPGVLPEAASQYAAGQWTPEQQAAVDAYMPTIVGQNTAFGNLGQAGNNLLANGVPAVQNAQTSLMQATSQPWNFGYDANTVNNVAQGAAPTATSQGYDAAQGTANAYTPTTAGAANTYDAALAEKVDPVAAAKIGQAAFANSSNADTAAIGTTPRDANINSLLAGDYDNPYLNQQIDTATGRLSNNFREQVMPAIGQGATMAGQYGGSRQGIAEGLASRALAQGMSDLEGSMRSNAYNQGFGARTALTGQLIGTDTQRDLTGAQLGTQVSLANASNATQTALANAQAANAQRQLEAQLAQQASVANAQIAQQRALQNSQLQTGANASNAAAANNMSQFNTAQENTAGLANSGLLANMSQFNAGAENTANQFGANAANANSQFNAGLDANMSQFNAGQTNSLGLANAQMQNAADQWTAGNSTQNAQFNATAQNQAAANNQNATNNTNQFNANLGLQNNAQDVNAMVTGGNLIGAGATGQNAAFTNQMNAMNMPNAQNQANLNNYANIVNTVAGNGGVQTQSNPYFTNPMGNALGLASGALGVYNQGANAGLWGNSSVPTSPNTAAAFGANPVMNFGQSGNSLFNSFG